MAVDIIALQRSVAKSLEGATFRQAAFCLENCLAYVIDEASRGGDWSGDEDAARRSVQEQREYLLNAVVEDIREQWARKDARDEAGGN